LPRQGPVIAIKRRHADQRSDLLVAKRAQFRHIGEERGAEHWSDTWDTAQLVLFLAPEWTGAQTVVQLTIELQVTVS
jgi:hypothetical protein